MSEPASKDIFVNKVASKDELANELTSLVNKTANEPMIEVLILTFNEANHIVEAVENTKQLGPVFVLDAASTDGTQALAKQAGATVVEHQWEGYAKQKNWGLDHLPWRGKWLFILDADERITLALRDELLKIAAATSEQRDGYFVNRLMFFMGKAIRHGGLYPSWNLRFFKRGSARYEDRLVHEHMICQGSTGYLKHKMIHIRCENLSQYIQKHIQYADLESDQWINQKYHGAKETPASYLFKKQLRLRQWLRRRIWPRLFGRPIWRFIFMYFVRLGFLDGRVGFHLAMLMAQYEYMIGLLYLQKIQDIQNSRPPQNKTTSSPA